MLNMRLIEEEVELVEKIYEAEHLTFNHKTLTESAVNWYSNTEIVEAEMLAAIVMTAKCTPEVLAEITWDELEKWREFYFPQVPFEYYEIGMAELKEARYDEFWR